ncbi:hypothetical protein COCOBI_02-0100 [Coccomyxa sp. Obi]|nr:hypothetical protein COCOBI_02-0100 [Coccomyxa sp. Obi]
MTTRRHNRDLITPIKENCKFSNSTGAMAERSQSPRWGELPSDVWALIGSHLGTRDFARASTAIKGLCGMQPMALNLAHNLSDTNKIGELVWGLKHSSRVLRAELSLDMCSGSGSSSRSLLDLVKAGSAFGMSLLARLAQLQLLELKAHVLLPLPVMPRLKHLTFKHYEPGPLQFEASEFKDAFCPVTP